MIAVVVLLGQIVGLVVAAAQFLGNKRLLLVRQLIVQVVLGVGSDAFDSSSVDKSNAK